MYVIHILYHIVLVDENHTTAATASLKNIVSHIHNIIVVYVYLFTVHTSRSTHVKHIHTSTLA